MKKLIVFLLTIAFVFCLNTKITLCEEYGGYARGYSDWSTTPTGNPGEVSAIQYGVLTPKRWSDWSRDSFSGQVLPTEPIDGHWYISDSIKASGYNGYHFQKSQDFGGERHVNDSNEIIWGDVGGKQVYQWDLGESIKITEFHIDVDCCKKVGEDYSNYYTPSMHLYVDGSLKASGGGWDGDLPNWDGNLNVYGRYVTLTMDDASGSGRNLTTIYGAWSFVTTSKIMYSHVIEWNEPANSCWRFTPYTLQDGAGSQIPVERIVYSYPYPPVIGLRTNYYFVGQEISLDDLKANVLATDICDGIINHKVNIDKIEYQDGTIVDNPLILDTSKEQSFELYASVTNSRNLIAEAHKSYMIFDLYTPSSVDPNDVNPEEYTDVDIYDRFVSKEYLDSINAKSIWEIDIGYKEALINALNKNDGSKSPLN